MSYLLTTYHWRHLTRPQLAGFECPVTAGWDRVIQQELENVFLIPGSADSKRLIAGVQSLLDEESLNMLTEMEKLDLNETCGCMLVASYTSAEFICLRVAESLLRRWYEKKEPGKVLEGKTWGYVLDEFSKLFPEKGRPDEVKVLGLLKNRRNEVAHPEKISKLQDARATLANVESLIESLKPYLSPTVC